jgi:acetyl-CoA acetyltransferase
MDLEHLNIPKPQLWPNTKLEHLNNISTITTDTSLGGLKCFGHPIGASGLRMLYEMYKQLQGKADKRQIKNPRLGLTHNLGGQPPHSVCSVCIVGL